MNQKAAAIEIVDPGLQTTVQDGGRHHVAHLGVSPSGFADWLSARIANRLVGNPHNAPLLEATMTGLQFVALEPLRIAVTGAHAALAVNNVERPLWQSVRVPANAGVRIHPATRGLRSYVAICAGIDVPQVLGSASTDTTAGFGGYMGRALARGDRLALMPREGELPEADVRVTPAVRPSWPQPSVLRVVRVSYAGRFSSEAIAFFQRQPYRVSPRGNRQGVRLEGRALPGYRATEIESVGVCAGCVQLSSDGLPIVLLSEHQTTGGYAVPFTVITADIPDAAQLRPGDEVRFRVVGLPEAAIALTEKMRALAESLHAADPMR